MVENSSGGPPMESIDSERCGDGVGTTDLKLALTKGDRAVSKVNRVSWQI